MTQPYRAPFDPKEMPDMPHMDTIHVQRNPHLPKPKMTPEREYILCEQAFGLRARGKTYRQMAALLGISVSAAYARAQTFMIAENERHEHFPSDTRAECESLLRQTVGPVVADAQQGNLASFRALVSYSNTMIKWSKVPNPSRRKLCRRIERLKKYMDEQDPDLSPTRRKQAEMAEQMAREAGEQTGEHAENARRTSGEQNQQPIAKQQVAPENTKSAQSSHNVGWVLAPTQEQRGAQDVAQAQTTEVVGASTHPTKEAHNRGGSAGINVVLVMILLAVSSTLGMAEHGGTQGNESALSLPCAVVPCVPLAAASEGQESSSTPCSESNFRRVHTDNTSGTRWKRARQELGEPKTLREFEIRHCHAAHDLRATASSLQSNSPPTSCPDSWNGPIWHGMLVPPNRQSRLSSSITHIPGNPEERSMAARRFWGIILCAIVLTGCEQPPAGGPAASNPKPATPAAAGEKVIGVSLLTLDNPFFKVIGNHIESEGEKHGYRTIVLSADKDSPKQHSQMKEFIVQKVAAIVISPCESRAIVPAIQEANAAGIPVFTVDIPCLEPGVEIVSQIATDNYGGGKEAGRAMIEALGDKGGKVAILHAKKFESCRLRVKGFTEVIKEHNAKGGNPIEIVGEYDSNGAKETGFNAGLDAIQKDPDLVGIFAINDPAALGAYTALEQSGKAKNVVLIGFDGQPEGKQAIKEGKIYADPIQFPDKMGVQVVEAIVDHAAGKKPKAEQLIPTALYRKADAEKDKDLK